MFREQEEKKIVPLFRIHIPLPKDKKPINFEELYNMTTKIFRKELNEGNTPKNSSIKKESAEIEKMIETDDQLQNKIKNQGLTRLEQTFLDIERRERNVKNSIVSSALSNEKVKSVPSKGDAYESDDSFIDDTEYDDYVIRPGGKDSFDDEIMTFEDEKSDEEEKEENEETGSNLASDSENENEIQSKTQNSSISDENQTFVPDMEKALEELSKKSIEQNLGSLKKIPDIFEQNLVFIAELRQKLYPRGFPKALYERIQKILNCPMQTLKNKMKKILEDNSLVNMKNQIKNQYEELKASVKTDILTALEKKLKPKTSSTATKTSQVNFTPLTIDSSSSPILPISDIQKMDHSRLVEYSKSQKITVIWSDSTKNLFLKSAEMLIESLQKEKDFTGKDFDQEKELSKFFKEIESYWPSKSDLKKKYKKLINKESNDKKKDDTSADKKRKKEESPKTDEKKKKKKLDTNTDTTITNQTSPNLNLQKDKKMLPKQIPSQQQQMYSFSIQPQISTTSNQPSSSFNYIKSNVVQQIPIVNHLDVNSNTPQYQSYLKTFSPQNPPPITPKMPSSFQTHSFIPSQQTSSTKKKVETIDLDFDESQ